MRKVSPDLTGQKFNKLVALHEDGRTGTNVLWRCLCDCGGTKTVTVHNLRYGKVKSCGCRDPKPVRLCEVDGCGTPVRCRGLCPSHYAKAVKDETAHRRVALTASRLKEVVHYDPEVGQFTRISGHRRDRHGPLSATADGNGYVQICIDGRKYFCHRLVWLYVHGHFPAEEIDHINGNRADYRLSNLRAVSRRTNAQNMRRPRVDNKSGYLGVSYDKTRDKWVARINTGDKYKLLGRFRTKEDASAAYIAAKRQYHEGCTI